MGIAFHTIDICNALGRKMFLFAIRNENVYLYTRTHILVWQKRNNVHIAIVRIHMFSLAEKSSAVTADTTKEKNR